jgi:hypothetical protein
MSAVVSVNVATERPWTGGNVRRRYLVVIEDNNAVQHDFTVGVFTVPPSDDGSQYAAQKLQQLKDSELRPEDKAPQWNDTQADYDRRSLGRAMLIRDVESFYEYLPLWLAMEGRSGSNAVQRSATLGIDKAIYDLMADRFGDVQGIAFFLDNAKGQIWEELPAGFE